MANQELKIRITAQDSTGAVLGKTRAGLESISRQLEVARNAFLAFQGAMLSLRSVTALAKLADDVTLEGWKAWISLAECEP